MSERIHPLRDLVTTRLASLCLNRRGRPRGLTYDDYLVRAALIVDLAVCGALNQTDTTVELDRARAAGFGLGPAAKDLESTGGSLAEWIDRGGPTFASWSTELVEGDVWRIRRRSLVHPLRCYEDTMEERTESDRGSGRHPGRQDDPSVASLAVYALGSVSGLFGEPHAPRRWQVADMGGDDGPGSSPWTG